jgi:hypothetical protein
MSRHAARTVAVFAGLGIVGALACASEDPSPSPSPTVEPARAQLVFEGLAGALLRVFGTSARDVWAIGADGDGRGGLVLHFDGARWRRWPIVEPGDLWWGEALGPGRARLVGEAGLVLDVDASVGVTRVRRTGGAETLFGIWGAERDAWVVGGRGARGVIRRDDGDIFTTPTSTAAVTAGAATFKVFGLAADAVYVVGQRGRAARWDGARFTVLATPTEETLFAVHAADAASVFAVGGALRGVVLRLDGDAWVDETPPDAPALNGVHVVSATLAYAVGYNGRAFRRSEGVWRPLAEDLPTLRDLHAVWVDPSGGLWAVGGQLASDPPSAGVLVHVGAPIPTTLE